MRKRSEYAEVGGAVNLRPFVGLGLVLMALLTVLGCATQQAAAPASEKPAAPGTEAPKHGGVLKVHYIVSAPSDLDALTATGSSTVARVQPAYSMLVRSDPPKSLESEVIAPDLAERWEVGADGKAVTFYLYKNAKWHDGTPVTAADVKYTFDRLMDPKDPQAGKLLRKRAGMDKVARVEAVDDHTVRFVLKQPSASLLSWLGYGSYMILPKHAWDKMDKAKDVMGSGPFRLKRYQVGVSIEYEKNPDYFLKDLPYVDGVTEFFLKDNATRVAAFTTKQLDLLRQIDQPLWEDIKRDSPDAKLIEWNTLRWPAVAMNLARKPWDDVRVRKAVALALDREEGNNIVARGWGTVGAYNPPGGPFSLTPEELSKMPGYGRDLQARIAEAKKLLAQAGYPDGFKAQMITTDFPPDEPLIVWVKEQLKKHLNIEGTIEILRGADYGVRRGELGTFDLDVASLVSLFGDPTGHTAYWGHGNYYAFKDQEIFDLLDRQDRTLDVAERKKLVREMELKLLERGPYTVITWFKSGSAAQPWVKNHYEPVTLYSNNRYDQAWIAK